MLNKVIQFLNGFIFRRKLSKVYNIAHNKIKRAEFIAKSILKP